jgi:DNA-binding CsgD family transcriptional regulator
VTEALLLSGDPGVATRVRAALVRHGIAARVLVVDPDVTPAAIEALVRDASARRRLTHGDDVVEPLGALRPREREVVRLLLDHHRVPGIARVLGISQQTVRNHLKRAFKCTGTHSQEELLLWVGRKAGEAHSGHLHHEAPVDYRRALGGNTAVPVPQADAGRV